MSAPVDVTVLAAASAGVTKVVDFVRNLVAAHLAGLSQRLPKWVWNAVAFAVGVFTALSTKLNVLSGVGWAGHVNATTGQVLTGVLLAGGAGVAHEVLDFLSSSAKAKQATALITQTSQVVADPSGGVSLPEP